jgi:hypothetical protein
MFFTEEFGDRPPMASQIIALVMFDGCPVRAECLRAGLALNLQLSVMGGSGIARFSGIYGGAFGSALKSVCDVCKGTGYVRKLDFGDAMIRFDGH